MAYKILDSRDIDQTYSPTSENPQSGKAVAEAVKTAGTTLLSAPWKKAGTVAYEQTKDLPQGSIIYVLQESTLDGTVLEGFPTADVFYKTGAVGEEGVWRLLTDRFLGTGLNTDENGGLFIEKETLIADAQLVTTSALNEAIKNIEVSGGGGTVDQTFNPESENAQSGKAVNEWVNENYLHYSERLSIASSGAFMAEQNLEPRFQSIEGNISSLSNRISDLSTQNKADETYNPLSENAQSGKAVDEALDKALYTTVEIPSEYISHFETHNGDVLEFNNGIHKIDSIYLDTIGLDIGTLTLNVDVYDIIDLNGATKIYLELGEYSDGEQEIKAVIIKKKYLDNITTSYFNNNDSLHFLNNYEYIASEPISYIMMDCEPYNGPYTSSIIFAISDTQEFEIDIENCKGYIGGVPNFKPGETWELNIKNGIVVAGKVVDQ